MADSWVHQSAILREGLCSNDMCSVIVGKKQYAEWQQGDCLYYYCPHFIFVMVLLEYMKRSDESGICVENIRCGVLYCSRANLFQCCNLWSALYCKICSCFCWKYIFCCLFKLGISFVFCLYIGGISSVTFCVVEWYLSLFVASVCCKWNLAHLRIELMTLKTLERSSVNSIVSCCHALDSQTKVQH